MKKIYTTASSREEAQCVPLVLVIDDSKFMNNYMSNMLKTIGCKVICALNGLEGVKLYQEYKPDIVMIDAVMPVMDGFNACATIRHMEGGKDALIYMITTKTDAESVERAFDAGCDDYFAKPILQSVFATRMKKILEEKSFGKSCEIASGIQSELSEARKLQMALLPKPVAEELVKVNYVYSPYDQVSGDFLDYWFDEEGNMMYGYVLDVTGHSIASAMQVFALRMLFCQCGRSGSLSNMLEYINIEMFRNDKKRLMATAIVFCIDITEKILHYASAGISPFYLIGKDRVQTVETAGFPLGLKRFTSYRTHTIAIPDIKEIIFASDGFTEIIKESEELIKGIPEIKAKHDDATAVFISLEKKERSHEIH